MFGEFETKLSEEGNWELMHVRVYQGLYVTKTENHYKRHVYEKVLKGAINFAITEHVITDKKDGEHKYYILEAKSGEEK
jgi:hypothetical protein